VTDTDTSRGPFRQLVFSGGGTRCFWQGGFLDASRDALPVNPDRITGVSDGVAAVADGPAFQILLGHPPASVLGKITGTLSTVAYEAELHSGGGPHLVWAERVGVGSTLVDARAAARNGRLTDLICAAAAIPPVFEPPLWDCRPVIDGGMVDQAPMPDPNEGSTLVLLTRDYASVPDRADRSYLAPSREVPADKIDFTEPDDIRRSWEIGEADGRRFLEAFETETEDREN
jgi:hypothetical protein